MTEHGQNISVSNRTLISMKTIASQRASRPAGINIIAVVKYFLPARRYASAGLCDSDVSVCLSVRPSVRPPHAGIVPSRAKA